MSRLNAGIGEAMYGIKKWLGVNESPDGDTNLKDGEAAAMHNFRITDGGALRKRPGSAIVAGLVSEYTVEADSTTETLLLSETGKSIAEFSGYPYVYPDSVGAAVPDGESVSFNYENNSDGVGYYCRYGGAVWRFVRTEYTEPEQQYEVSGSGGFRSGDIDQHLCFYVFDEPPVFHDGQWDLSKGYVWDVTEKQAGVIGKYMVTTAAGRVDGVFEENPDVSEFEFNSDGKYAYIFNLYFEMDIYTGWYFRPEYFVYTSPVYSWYFNPVLSYPNESDQNVRGIWSGYVGEHEYIVAACNGYLWTLSEEGGVWSKRSIGTIDTSDHVCLFGFDSKLYCLDGKEYYVWDENTFHSVSGYVPLIGNASSPSGATSTLERVNLLTPQRRQRFSSDGTSTVYVLAEKGLDTIDRVIVDGSDASDYSASAADGTVTFTAAPAAGTDNVEIWYSAKESYRSKITAMRYAEFYNGANDSRVFLYGDGSNITVYSDLSYDTGMPSAEYFPDLNEIAVGDSNTPLTALIRQYSRLMAFKKGGSAWSIYYDSMTLADGTVTAGFYCNGVNRSVGNDALGQAVLVENKPRTVDGRSIYEWQSSSGGYVTNDQRNAKRISQKVEATLLSFDLAESIMFFDKINHEFYCVYKDRAVVQNTENDAWYIYENFPAAAIIVYKDELYYGTAQGDLCRFSDDYTSDNGSAIDCHWESGSMSFGRDYVQKYSPSVWVGLKQESKAEVTVGIATDRAELITESISLPEISDAMPRMNRRRLKAQKFTYYKLIFKSHSADTRATVVAADIKVKYGANVK